MPRQGSNDSLARLVSSVMHTQATAPKTLQYVRWTGRRVLPSARRCSNRSLLERHSNTGTEELGLAFLAEEHSQSFRASTRGGGHLPKFGPTGSLFRSLR